MNFPGDFAILDPGAIKRLLLVLFVVVTLGVKLSDIVDARRAKARRLVSDATNAIGGNRG